MVKAFGQESTEDIRFEKSNNRVREAEINIVHYQNRFSVAYSIAKDVPSLLVWAVGALIILHADGAFRYGSLLTFVGLSVPCCRGQWISFPMFFQWWSGSMNSAQRIFEIIRRAPRCCGTPEGPWMSS